MITQQNKNITDAKLDALTNEELLQNFIGKNKTKEIYKHATEEIEKTREETTTETINNIQNLTETEKLKIASAFHLYKRIFISHNEMIKSPNQIIKYLQPYATEEQEHLIGIYLNAAFMIIKIHLITKGVANTLISHPREIFKEGIKNNATALILAHNHPSGNLEPSPEDIEMTKRISKCGKLIGIPLIDHIIFHGTKHYSIGQNQPSLIQTEKEYI